MIVQARLLKCTRVVSSGLYCVGRGNILYAEFTRLSDYDFSAPDVFVEIFDVDRVRFTRLDVARLGPFGLH